MADERYRANQHEGNAGSTAMLGAAEPELRTGGDAPDAARPGQIGRPRVLEDVLALADVTLYAQ